MVLFSSGNRAKLNQFFQVHNIHDSRIRKVHFCAETCKLFIDAWNLESGDRISFEFENVESFVMKQGHFPGRSDEISYAGAGDDVNLLCQKLSIAERCYWLYFIFEFVSGGDIQVLCEDVLIDVHNNSGEGRSRD